MKKHFLLLAVALAVSLGTSSCHRTKPDAVIPTGQPSAAPARLPDNAPETRNWAAWIDKMPPGPARMHVKGEVNVPNGGSEPRLAKAASQGSDPAILILDLTLFQNPGPRTQAFKWAEARFQERPARATYKAVHIRWEGNVIEKIDVTETF